MLSKIKFEIFLLFTFFLFSIWLMYKSFGYDAASQSFYIARHQIADFGLHLSLARSFSWGDNIPPESPFFPGKPLPYHYYFDFFVGMLEKMGVRIDLALNGLSILAFTSLLYLIYRLPQVIFSKSTLLGILSVVLFVFHSGITFVDFLKEKSLSLATLRDLWFLPDYTHKGPFDDSIVSIFFTLNVFLNQRHLIMGLVITLSLLLFLIPRLLKSQKIPLVWLILVGAVLGLSSRVHTLSFLSTLLVVICLFAIFKRMAQTIPILLSALLFFSPHLIDILGQNLSHKILNPTENFIQFWIPNLGMSLIVIPLGFILSSSKQKKIFLSFLPLFIIGNLLQLSFRIEHNHTLFNLFLIFANFYGAFFLLKLWQGRVLQKIIFCFLLFFMTASGVVDLMAIKNDFRLSLQDASRSEFMQWIKTRTSPRDVFLSKQELLDPITLSGRKNYLGHQFYLEVMGYDFYTRKAKVKTFFEANDVRVFEQMRKEQINYIVIPKRQVADFNYAINKKFFEENLNLVYEDDDFLTFRL